jgi:hypothetical protein
MDVLIINYLQDFEMLVKLQTIDNQRVSQRSAVFRVQKWNALRVWYCLNIQLAAAWSVNKTPFRHQNLYKLHRPEQKISLVLGWLTLVISN